MNLSVAREAINVTRLRTTRGKRMLFDPLNPYFPVHGGNNMVV